MPVLCWLFFSTPVEFGLHCAPVKWDTPSLSSSLCTATICMQARQCPQAHRKLSHPQDAVPSFKCHQGKQWCCGRGSWVRHVLDASRDQEISSEEGTLQMRGKGRVGVCQVRCGRSVSGRKPSRGKGPR